jgi:hypothetical protein
VAIETTFGCHISIVIEKTIGWWPKKMQTMIEVFNNFLFIIIIRSMVGINTIALWMIFFFQKVIEMFWVPKFSVN